MWFEARSAGGKTFRVNVKESGVRYNYSQMASIGPQSGYYWSNLAGHTEKYYSKYGNYWGSPPIAALSALIRFPIGNDNCVTMSPNPDEQFYGIDASTLADGAIMSTSEGSNFKFSFFTRTEQSVSYAYCGGFFLVNPYGYSGQSEEGLNPYNSPNRFIYESDETKIPALTFWLVTMHDDVQSSATYGQDFDVIMIAIRGGRVSESQTVSNTFVLFDARMFKGASNLTPTKSTTRGNSPTGWTGSRNDRSDSDTESHIGSALKAFVNNFEYGTHLYRLSHNQMQDFFNYLWSDNTWNKAAREKNNPIRGVISLHHMPTHVSAKGVQECIKLCGEQAVIFNTLGTTFEKVMADVAADSKVELKTKVFHPKEYSYSFLDWSSNTRIKFRLPFIGVVPINVNAIMDGGIFAKYNIDFITGNCLVQIYTIPQKAVMGTDEDWSETYDGCLVMLAQYSGNCAHKLNVSTCDFGGATALGSIVNATVGVGTAILGAATENPMMIWSGAVQSANAMKNYMTRHETTSVIGATPNADTMGMMIPALIIERPIDLTPLNDQGVGNRYQDFVGRPAASGGKVKDYKAGFEDGKVFIQGILHADTLYATEAEKKEIEAGFAKGMYV